MIRLALIAACLAVGPACAQVPAGIESTDLHSGWSLPPIPSESQFSPDVPSPVGGPLTASASSAPVPISSCDPAGCWDNQGTHYSGGGTIMTRTDGAVCQQIGTTIQCF